MPTYCFGDMWTAYDDSQLFLVTTNSVVTDGKLVMGAGIALQAQQRFPGIERAFGQAIGSREVYGLLVSPQWPERKLGAFQTKRHWREKATVAVIQNSVHCLLVWLREHPGVRVDLAYPGIGHGGLAVEDVEPVISGLPGDVRVWRYSKEG